MGGLIGERVKGRQGLKGGKFMLKCPGSKKVEDNNHARSSVFV